MMVCGRPDDRGDKPALWKTSNMNNSPVMGKKAPEPYLKSKAWQQFAFQFDTQINKLSAEEAHNNSEAHRCFGFKPCTPDFINFNADPNPESKRIEGILLFLILIIYLLFILASRSKRKVPVPVTDVSDSSSESDDDGSSDFQPSPQKKQKKQRRTQKSSDRELSGHEMLRNALANDPPRLAEFDARTAREQAARTQRGLFNVTRQKGGARTAQTFRVRQEAPQTQQGNLISNSFLYLLYIKVVPRDNHALKLHQLLLLLHHHRQQHLCLCLCLCLCLHLYLLLHLLQLCHQRYLCPRLFQLLSLSSINQKSSHSPINVHSLLK